MTLHHSVKKKISAGNERIFYLILIMLAVTFTSVLLATTILYYSAFEEQEQRLLETAKSQARLMEAVAQFDKTHGEYRNKDEAFQATLSQFAEANSNFEGFGKTGEFALAELKKDKIIFLLQHRHEKTRTAKELSSHIKMGSRLAEPMQQALKGKTGVMVGIDYRGEKVLAAFDPVDVEGMDLGIVAKIDIGEIIQPFIKVFAITAIIGIVFISIATLIFKRVGQPLVREIQESEERFRSTFEQAAVGMAHVAPDGKWLYVNEKICHILEYKREELLEKTFRDITYGEDILKGERAADKIMAGELDDYSAEKRYVKSDGSLLWVNVNISLVRKSTGQPKYFIYVIKDISDRKKAEEELAHKKRLAEMGEMSAHIAHDIRSPLHTIALAYDYLQADSTHSKKVMEALDCLGDGIENLTSIVTDLLDFGRKDTLNKESLDLNELIRTALWKVRSVVNQKNIKVIEKLDKKNPQLHTDKVKVRRVLSNVMDNAIHSMDEGGMLTVSTGHNGNEMNIVISDTGSGIAAENMDNIFKPFFTTKSRGTGLGMSIVKHYVELHKGTVSLHSEIGKGTTVTMSLPV